MKTFFDKDKLLNLRRFQFIARNTFTHEEIISDTSDCKKVDKIIWGSAGQ